MLSLLLQRLQALVVKHPLPGPMSRQRWGDLGPCKVGLYIVEGFEILRPTHVVVILPDGDVYHFSPLVQNWFR